MAWEGEAGGEEGRGRALVTGAGRRVVGAVGGAVGGAGVQGAGHERQ